MAQEKLLFCPNASQIDSTFWGRFCKLKLDVLGLNEDPLPLSGQYGSNEIPNTTSILSVDHSSLDSNANAYSGMVKVPGLLINTNTAEQFKQVDKNDLMKNMGSNLLGKLWTDEGLREISTNPSVLGSFFILTFADLKKYKFVYWFGFPAVGSLSVERLGQREPVSKHLNTSTLEDTLRNNKEILNTGFFILNQDKEEISLKSLESIDGLNKDNLESTIFAFLDPSSLEDPGWILRNYITFLARKLNLVSGSELRVLAYRPRRASLLETSYIFRVKIEFEDQWDVNPKYIGWERNAKGAFGPRQVDLQMSMNPEKFVNFKEQHRIKDIYIITN